MKACFKCGISKPLSEFYVHKMMADGHLNKCKTCTKRDVVTFRRANISKVRDYDRRRALRPARIAKTTVITREWRRRHKDRASAHGKAHRAKLVPPHECEMCDQPSTGLEKHHHDYSKPRDIIWLCKPCHCVADSIRRYMETHDWMEDDRSDVCAI